ncbi:WASH complex subunit 2A isoform X2 [Latimeria chalumnae]|uniref:WASH complex subunit 2A isoform X2 n=1 Tax=Latimeria chalumnae TaxID=7897 RepID=UPI00313DDBBE
MNGPSVNGPTGQNDSETEAVWERSWSLEEMQNTSGSWSLAADAGLLLFLQDFSQRMMARTHEIEKQLDGLICETKATDCCLHNVFNDFLMLSNTQFIENRVYDEEVEEPVSKPEVGEKPEQEKTREQKEAELIPKVQEAVNYGLRVLDLAFEQLDIKAGNSDSEDEEANERVEPILEPKDLYIDRPLPYLIGSVPFMERDDVGLGDLSSEEESVDSDRIINSEEEKDDEDFEEESEDQNEQKMTNQKSIYISDEEEDGSDLFGESEKEEDDNEDEEQENAKKKKTRPSFADELAARIKGEVPESKEDEQAVPSAEVPTKKDKRKKEMRKAKPEVDEDDDYLFGPPKLEDEDFSPFGGKSGLFSGGKGLFDDDEEEGDLFGDAPKERIKEENVIKPAKAKEPSVTKTGKKIPVGGVSILPDEDLFSSNSVVEEKEKKEKTSKEKSSLVVPKQVTTSGLFDDEEEEEEEEDDFFSGSNSRPSNSAAGKTKRATDLFGGGGGDDDDDDDVNYLFQGQTGLTQSNLGDSKASEAEMNEGAKPEKKNILSSPEVCKSSPKMTKKTQRSLFSDEEDSQDLFSSNQNMHKNLPKRASLPQNKPSVVLFDDDEEANLFGSAPNKDVVKQSLEAKPSRESKQPKPGLLFSSDDEDQWKTSKPSHVTNKEKQVEKAETVTTVAAAPTANKAVKASLFDFDEEDLFVVTKEHSQKSQKVSLLFEEEEEGGFLFGSKPQTNKSVPVTAPKPAPSLPDQSPPKESQKEALFESPTEKALLSEEKVEVKKKPAGALALFGGIDVLKQQKAEKLEANGSSPEKEPDDNDLYKEAPPPLEKETKSKTANILSLFHDDDDEEEFDQDPFHLANKPIDREKPLEQKPCTKSTGVFQDEELLFSHKQQKDNDPDVDLFAAAGKPVAVKPSSGKASSASGLFGGGGDGDEEEEDLFGPVKSKPPPVAQKKAAVSKDSLDASSQKVKDKDLGNTPEAEINKKPKAPGPIKMKEPSSRIGKLQVNLAINPAKLLPGAAPRALGAESVMPGSPTEATRSTTSPSGAESSEEMGVNFDSPAQADTLHSVNKSRAKMTGKRRPPTRVARHSAIQQSDEMDKATQKEDRLAIQASAAVGTKQPPAVEPARVPAQKENSNLVTEQLLTAERSLFEKTTDVAPATKPKLPDLPSDLFGGGGDLFASSSVQKQAAAAIKTKERKSEGSVSKPSKVGEPACSVFGDPGGDDLFQSAKQKVPKKHKLVSGLEDDLFGSAKTVAVKKTSKVTAQKDSKPLTQNIFEDDIFATEASKPSVKTKAKEKSLDSNLFVDDVDIFADLSVKPKEKKKKKVEAKSIFDEDMDDIFSSGNKTKTSKLKSKSSQPVDEAPAGDSKATSVFDDPLNVLGSQ